MQALFGLGFDVKLSPRITLRAEAVSYDKDAKRLGVALLYRFGSREHSSTPVLAETLTSANGTIEAQSRTVGLEPGDQKPALAAARAKQSKPMRTPTLVRFDVDSSRLSTAQQRVLQNLARDTKTTPVRVVASGHADSSGLSSYNEQLSTVRAQSVRSYLILQGVDPENLTAVGYGETDPVADNALPEGRAMNRRVDINIFSEGTQ